MNRVQLPLFLLVLGAEIAIVLVASSFYTGQVLLVLISAFSGVLLALVVVSAWWAKRRRLRDYRYSSEVEVPAEFGTEPPTWFEGVVQSAVDDLPDELRGWMTNVDVVVEDEPPRPSVLGLYRGVPLTRRGSAYSHVLPDKISIYRGPLERLYGNDPARLEQQIRHTVRHEIAHHFGISDERLIEIDRY